MTTYIIRRLIQAFIVVIITSVFVFILIRYLPGDPVLVYISMDDLNTVVTKGQINALRHEFGLDRPVFVQYVDWLWGVVRGDLGDSIFLNVPVSQEIARALPKTLMLGVCALFVSISLGIPFGLISAVRRGGWLDTVVTFIANIGITAPVFWVGIILISVFGVILNWLPVMGYTSVFSDPLECVRKMIMPVFCLALFPMAAIARQTRSAMLEVVNQDYIRTAWAKGLVEKTIIFRHALKNGLIPVITLVGFQMRGVIGGAVLIESVFSIPGMGRLAVESLQNQDYAVVQGVILVAAILTTLLNLMVDISYGYIDPRIRYS